MGPSAVLASLPEATVCLLSEGRPSAADVEDCLEKDRRLTASPTTRPAARSPTGTIFQFRMDASVDWTTQRRDDGALNRWYRQSVPMAHRVGQVISPLMAIVAVPGLSSACMRALL